MINFLNQYNPWKKLKTPENKSYFSTIRVREDTHHDFYWAKNSKCEKGLIINFSRKGKDLKNFSVLILEGIFFFNFTSPEFNVNISQIPFFALITYYLWKGINSQKISDWILFGIFSAFGFLSKYLFIYFLFSIFYFYFSFIEIRKL